VTGFTCLVIDELVTEAKSGTSVAASTSRMQHLLAEKGQMRSWG
jgi:hypothetical protein